MDFIKDWWPLVAWCLGLTATVIAWGSRIESRLNATIDLVKEHYATKADLANLAAVKPQLEDMKQVVDRMDRKLDTLILNRNNNGRMET